MKAERDEGPVEESLAELREAVAADENTIPYVVDAVKAYATMGEIMQVYEDAYGSYSEQIGLA